MNINEIKELGRAGDVIKEAKKHVLRINMAKKRVKKGCKGCKDLFEQVELLKIIQKAGYILSKVR